MSGKFLPLQFFFFFKHQRKKYTHKPDSHLKIFIYIMIFVFSEVFLIHNNLVTQNISYCKIIDQSRKRCSFFYKQRRCVNFLKYCRFSYTRAWELANLFVGTKNFSYHICYENIGRKHNKIPTLKSRDRQSMDRHNLAIR